METLTGAVELRRSLGKLPAAAMVGLVPTMGAFHGGHLSLMRRARADADRVVVSLFVNPAQFGPGEDLNRYPRDPARDAALARSEGVDILFAPPVEAIYPPGFQTWVEVDELARPLCGAARPGHFRGVATVVTKLLQIVRPHRAYFGEKDYQQLKIVQRLVADLDMPVAIVPCPIVREPDGVALSSRNRRLTPEGRTAARALPESLSAATALFAASERAGPVLRAASLARLNAEPLVRVDYVEVVDAETLANLEQVDRPARLCVAALVGDVRLIDNAHLG